VGNEDTPYHGVNFGGWLAVAGMGVGRIGSYGTEKLATAINVGQGKIKLTYPPWRARPLATRIIARVAVVHPRHQLVIDERVAF
jgi:hypothetical protein